MLRNIIRVLRFALTQDRTAVSKSTCFRLISDAATARPSRIRYRALSLCGFSTRSDFILPGDLLESITIAVSSWFPIASNNAQLFDAASCCASKLARNRRICFTRDLDPTANSVWPSIRRICPLNASRPPVTGKADQLAICCCKLADSVERTPDQYLQLSIGVPQAQSRLFGSSDSLCTSPVLDICG